MQQAASASAVGAPASYGNVPPPPAAAPSNTLPSTFVETDMEQQQDAQGYTDEFAKDLLGDFVDSADEKDQSLPPAKRARVSEAASPTAPTVPGDPFAPILVDESQAWPAFDNQAQAEVQVNPLLQQGAPVQGTHMIQPDPPPTDQTTANTTSESLPQKHAPTPAAHSKQVDTSQQFAFVPKQSHPPAPKAPSAKPLDLLQPKSDLVCSGAKSPPSSLQAPADTQQQLQDKAAPTNESSLLLKIQQLEAALAAVLASQSQPSHVAASAPHAQQIPPPAPLASPGHTATVAAPQQMPPVVAQQMSPPVAALAQGHPGNHHVVIPQPVPAMHTPLRGPQIYPQAASPHSQSQGSAKVTLPPAMVTPPPRESVPNGSDATQIKFPQGISARKEEVLNLGSTHSFIDFEC